MDRPTLLLLITTVLATFVVAWTWTAAGRARLLRATARRADLALPADAAPVARRLQGRLTAGVVGAVSGLALAVLVVPADGPDGAVPSPAVPSVIGLAFVGLALATAAHSLVVSRRPVAADGPRVARGRDVGLADYVNGFERRSAVVVSLLPGVVALVAGGAVVTGLLEAPPVRVGLLVLLAVVPPVVLVGSLGLVRAVLTARQPAGSTEELAWDDALRSLALRDVISVPLYAGLVATVLAGAEIAVNLPPALAPAATGVLVLGLLLVGTVVLALSVAGRPARHFRSTLWPYEQAGSRP